MKLLIFTSLAMLAFAANSVLNRMALSSGSIDPMGFAAIRVLAGASVLYGVYLIRHRSVKLVPQTIWAPIGLVIYMLGFSWAYLSLEAGFGALLLFGVVQLAMFAVGFFTGARPLGFEMLGAGLAFAGLAYLLAPSLQVGGMAPSLAMILAGIGWAIFTLAGRGARDPLALSAASFLYIVPITAIAWIGFGDIHFSIFGLGLAVLSGAVTSGIGYLIWYAVLPKLAVPTAALVQLTVPIIAIALGAALLGEDLTTRLVIAATAVTIGVGIGIEARRRQSR